MSNVVELTEIVKAKRAELIAEGFGKLGYEAAWLCFVCGLDDTLDGLGDGMTTCACDRCPECSKRPGLCGCADKYEDRVDYDR